MVTHMKEIQRLGPWEGAPPSAILLRRKRAGDHCISQSVLNGPWFAPVASQPPVRKSITARSCSLLMPSESSIIRENHAMWDSVLS